MEPLDAPFSAPAPFPVPSDSPPQPFRPASGAGGPHAQTLLGKLLRPTPAFATLREVWETPDGDVVTVDLEPGVLDSQRPLVLVLHGLEGSSRRSYVRLLMEALRERGIASVALNFRGCGGAPNRLARAYHSGDSEELAWVAERLRTRFAGRPLGAAGFSLGGNVLAKYLGEVGTASVFRGAAVASVPFDLDEAERWIDRSGIRRIYRRYFLRSLKEKVEAKRHLLEPQVVARVRAARTLRAFDDALTAPLHGFRDATDYYRRASSGPLLAGIAIPTLVLHAADDPFLPAAGLPLPALRANPAVDLRLPAQGGHLGFLAGSLRRPLWWAETNMAIFLARVLGDSKTPTSPEIRARNPT